MWTMVYHSSVLAFDNRWLLALMGGGVSPTITLFIYIIITIMISIENHSLMPNFLLI